MVLLHARLCPAEPPFFRIHRQSLVGQRQLGQRHRWCGHGAEAVEAVGAEAVGCGGGCLLLRIITPGRASARARPGPHRRAARSRHGAAPRARRRPQREASPWSRGCAPTLHPERRLLARSPRLALVSRRPGSSREGGARRGRGSKRMGARAPAWEGLVVQIHLRLVRNHVCVCVCVSFGFLRRPFLSRRGVSRFLVVFRENFISSASIAQSTSSIPGGRGASTQVDTYLSEAPPLSPVCVVLVFRGWVWRPTDSSR